MTNKDMRPSPPAITIAAPPSTKNFFLSFLRKSQYQLIHRENRPSAFRCTKNITKLHVLSLCCLWVLLGFIFIICHRANDSPPPETTHSLLFQYQDSLLVHKKNHMRVSGANVKYFSWGLHTEEQIKIYKEKTMMILFYDKSDSSADRLLQDMHETAVAMQETPMIYVSVDTQEISPFEFILDDHYTQQVPFVLITEPHHGFRKFRLESSPTLQTMLQFTRDYYQKTIRPWLRTEKEIPQEKDLAIKQITSEEFNKLVIEDPSSDALVFFYAPWCGHCKRFSLILDEIAQKIRNVPFIRIYKIDATKNDIDHPSIAIERVPYVRYFSAKNKSQPILFKHTEPRLLEYAMTFLVQNASRSFDLEKLDREAEMRNSNAQNEF